MKVELLIPKSENIIDNYEVFILDTCSPFILEVQEHKYIQLLKSLKPHGLNAVDPFGIPILKF